MVSLGLPCWGHPHPIGVALGGEPTEKASPANLLIPSPVFLHNLTRWLSAAPELHKTCLWFRVDNKRIIKG